MMVGTMRTYDVPRDRQWPLVQSLARWRWKPCRHSAVSTDEHSTSTTSASEQTSQRRPAWTANNGAATQPQFK